MFLCLTHFEKNLFAIKNETAQYRTKKHMKTNTSWEEIRFFLNSLSDS